MYQNIKEKDIRAWEERSGGLDAVQRNKEAAVGEICGGGDKSDEKEDEGVAGNV